MNRERMENLARVLRDVKGKTKPFDMGIWGDPHSCGTAACAAGWTMRDPWFRSQGLIPTGLSHIDRTAPRYDGDTHFFALEEFFEIGEKETRLLFSPDIEGDSLVGKDLSIEAVLARVEEMLR